MSTGDPWYRRFGNIIAPAYAAGDDMASSAGTTAEVAFIRRELIAESPTGWCILDVGCGTGRHSRALATLGHQITAVDCSPGLLAVAQALATRDQELNPPHDATAHRDGSMPVVASVRQPAITWVELDARHLPFRGKFDLVLCLYGGGFGVGEDDADDEAVLQGMAQALRPDGMLLLTANNALGLVTRFVERAVMTGDDELRPPFDPVTFLSHATTATGPDGSVLPLPSWWRAYTTRELTLLCRLHGLTVEGIYGCVPGDWQRRPIRLDDSDLLLIARKTVEVDR